MFFLMLILLGKSEPFHMDYKAEGFKTLEPSSSPAQITLTKGLALMMVSWPDATLKINIPGVLSKPVKLTAKDKFSLFTFANSSSIEIEFSSAITYFIIECPQFNSYGGATQFCSNYKQNKYSISSAYKDLYYSVYGPYTMTGSISLSLLGSATLHYWVNGSTELTTTDLKPLNLPTIRFTSALIRSKVIDSISYDPLTIVCSTNINPTVPTSVALEWESVSANKNNFLQNMAYGGSESSSNLVSNLISDLPTDDSYSLRIIIDKNIYSDSSFEIDTGTGKIKISQDYIVSRSSSFTANLYITFKECKSKQFQTVTVDKIGIKIINLSLSSIPKDCSASATYTVQITATSSISYTLGIQTDDGLISESSVGGMLITSKSANHPFILSLYVKNKYCTTMTKVKEISILKSGTTKIEFSDSDLPDQCLYEKKNYYVKIRNSLSSKVEQAVLLVKDRNNEEKIVNQGTTYTDSYKDYKAFTVQVLIQTAYCQKLSVKFITATESSNEIIIDDSAIPNQCLPYMVCLSSDLSSDYSIGYQNIHTPLSEIKQLNEEIILQDKEAFDVQIFLIKSPSCESNYKLAKITAEKSFKCNRIAMNNIPSSCLPKYYEVCFDINSLPSKYEIFYKVNNDQQLSLLTSSPIQKLVPFNVTLFLTESPGCSSIELKSYIADINPQCNILTESDIPAECRENYNYISIKNALSSNENKLYIQNRITHEYIELSQNQYNNDSDTTSFNLNVYMKSPYCIDYTLVKSVYSTKNKNDVVYITDSDIPKDCQKRYIACFSVDLSTQYQIAYTLSYGQIDYKYWANDGINKITNSDPFSMKIYLIRSPGCTDDVLLYEIEASQFDKCQSISEYMIPEKCKKENVSPNEKVQTKGINPIFIGSIAGVVGIVIIIVIVVTITIIKKKKNKLNETNSQTLGSNLLLRENYGSNNNF